MTTLSTLSTLSPADTPLYEGKTKRLLRHPSDATLCIAEFKDDATAFNGLKHERFEGKGSLNARITAELFRHLANQGLPTCFVASTDTPHQLIYQRLTMIPLEIVVRNDACGSLCKRYPWLEAGHPLPQPVIEFPYKSDAHGDPVMSESLIEALGLIPAPYTLQDLKRLALQANDALLPLFESLNIRCADFKLEVGLNAEGDLVLADELSPDNFRLRDITTGQILDKDVFRLNQGALMEAYQTVATRLDTASTPQRQKPQQTYHATLNITYRSGILHPESKAVLEAVHQLGLHTVKQLTVGKHVSITLNAQSHAHAEAQLQHLAEELLINPVIETLNITHLVQHHV
ncbi:MAG: phosphoribosylformylglycinamidine synthase subunit PurS [Vampirovibrionales bacterium]